jgi:hypothetical protein
MSAINDALRRASSVAKSANAAPPLPPMPTSPAPIAPLPHSSVPAAPPPIITPPSGLILIAPNPTSTSQAPARGGWKLVLLIGLFLAGLGSAGAFYVWQKNAQRQSLANKVAAPERAKARNVRSSTPSNNELAEKTAEAEIRGNSTPVPDKTLAKSTTVASNPSPVAAASPAVRFPPLRLQSIFYRPANPSVIINGKTLFLTDEISGVVVADIQPSSVTLVLSGQTNVLTLR